MTTSFGVLLNRPWLTLPPPKPAERDGPPGRDFAGALPPQHRQCEERGGVACCTRDDGVCTRHWVAGGQRSLHGPGTIYFSLQVKTLNGHCAACALRNDGKCPGLLLDPRGRLQRSNIGSLSPLFRRPASSHRRSLAHFCSSHACLLKEEIEETARKMAPYQNPAGHELRGRSFGPSPPSKVNVC
ncbi:hypothetical protein LY78DRAFT_65951 [Colletotrichum sublineola]|nr:hypothetical protein LY78DRAFT_65951 [Colletotrichum sublineola]